MKRIISMLIVITIILILLPHASADLNDGLVAYWPFNGNANDYSGNGNHGTVIGAILTDDRFGNADSAYSFDGINDLISIPDKPIWTLGTKPFTVALWVKLRQIKGRDPFIGHDEGSGERNKWIFWYDARGHDKPRGPALRFHINSPSLRPTDTVFSPWNPTVGEWYHVAVTRSNNSYSLFINGKNVASENDDNNIPDPNYPLTIGKAEAYYLNGLIDDVRIYNRALSETEIKKLFNEKCSFVDVPPGFWAEEHICEIYGAGITKGCAQDPLMYCPLTDVTREQMAAFLIRAVEGEPPANYCATGSPFPDVSPTSFFCKYIKRLFELGITTGYGDGTYRPKNNVTRAQMAAFLARAFLGMD